MAIGLDLALSSIGPRLHSLDRYFPNQADRSNITLGEVASLRLGHLVSLDKFNQTTLRGIVAITRSRLQLRNHAGSGLQDGDGMNFTLLIEYLRHADFLTQNSSN